MIATGAKEPGDNYTEAWTECEVVEHSTVSRRERHASRWPDDLAEPDLAEAAVERGAILDKILIVTDGFHEDRCLAISSELGFTRSRCLPRARRSKGGPRSRTS